MNRGAAYQEIFISDVHRFLFLDLMGEIRNLFGVECHAYCLMGNHYHVLIHTLQVNLGRGMRDNTGQTTVLVRQRSPNKSGDAGSLPKCFVRHARDR